MDSKEIKGIIDGMFPCEWSDDFLRDLRGKLEGYCNFVKSLPDIESNVKKNVICLSKKLIDIVELCYEGRRSDAFIEFRNIMNGDTNEIGLFSSIGSVIIKSNDLFYRGRKRQEGVEFSIKDMFHMPLNKRGLVSTQRYSTPGFPCLYLGNSIYSCWEELNRPIFDHLRFSAFKVRHDFGVFDMRIPNEDDYSMENLNCTLQRIPLILACSFMVNNKNDVFKPEYIIPQMLIEIIICNNKEITKQKKSPLDSDVIWGVIYTSTHVNDEFPYGRKFLENIVLPIVETKNKALYCYFLASLFDLSKPLCYEYEILKENETRSFWDDISQKTEEEQIKELYAQSKMGYLEDKLKQATFITLPHIVVGCPSGGIVLNQNGYTQEIEVRSSGEFNIE